MKLHRKSSKRMIAGWAMLALAGLAGAWPAAVLGQVSPAESARRLKAGPGLEATLWASEPMLANPTNIDIDSRGQGVGYRGAELSAEPGAKRAVSSRRDRRTGSRFSRIPTATARPTR